MKKDFWEFVDDFFGDSLAAIWDTDDTSSAGTPTYTVVDGAETGAVALTLDNTNEVQNVCLSMGDQLCFDIDNIVEVEYRVKQGQATIDSATSVVFGLAGDRNDATDSVAQNCWFRLVGSNSLVIETDDGTTDNDDKATGVSLTNAYKDFKISFAAGKSDIRFFIDGQPVATGITFSMAAYTGSLQLLVQIQKTQDTNADSIVIDRVRIRGRR